MRCEKSFKTALVLFAVALFVAILVLVPCFATPVGA